MYLRYWSRPESQPHSYRLGRRKSRFFTFDQVYDHCGCSTGGCSFSGVVRYCYSFWRNIRQILIFHILSHSAYPRTPEEGISVSASLSRALSGIPGSEEELPVIICFFLAQRSHWFPEHLLRPSMTAKARRLKDFASCSLKKRSSDTEKASDLQFCNEEECIIYWYSAGSFKEVFWTRCCEKRGGRVPSNSLGPFDFVQPTNHVYWCIWKRNMNFEEALCACPRSSQFDYWWLLVKRYYIHASDASMNDKFSILIWKGGHDFSPKVTVGEPLPLPNWVTDGNNFLKWKLIQKVIMFRAFYS